MDSRILNRDYTPACVQVTHLYGMTTDRYTNKKLPFLLKNISDEVVEATIYPAAMVEDKTLSPIKTTLQPGWNPELVIGVESEDFLSLQYGY
jgi:hypothetical protein